MKKHLKQWFCLALVLALIVCMAACGDKEESAEESGKTESTASSETSENPDNKYLDADGKYMPLIGVLDEYKDKTFTILVVGESAGTYQSDDFTTSQGSGGIDYGETFYNEVNARNELVEERYGITLEVAKLDNATNEARNDAMSGTKLYDAVILNVSGVAGMAQEGLLYNLYDLENFDIQAPWWDANATASYSVGDKLYFLTGDITIMNKVNTWSILFNKDMIENFKLDSPYDLFDSHQWTYDKMCEMAVAANSATSAADIDNPSATFGMVSAYGDIYRFYGGSGATLCTKDSENKPELLFGDDENSINTTVHILEKLNDANWNVYAEEVPGTWDASFKMFYTGRVLFRPSGFSATTKLRALAEMEFGIVPMPMLSDTQDEYWTVTDGSFAAAILKNCEDPEFSAYMLDAFGAQAKNFITPAYIEANLKWRALRDDASEAILDYIFDHIHYDVAQVYNFGDITNLFYNLAKAHSTDVMSSFDAIRDEVLTAIEDVVTDYENDI